MHRSTWGAVAAVVVARWEGVGVLPLESLISAKLEPRQGSSAPGVSADPLIERNPLSEPAWMRHIASTMHEASTVMLGNSLPIREWNLAAASARPDTAVFANRGANGIEAASQAYFDKPASELTVAQGAPSRDPPVHWPWG